MSNRSNEKRITREAKVLRYLRLKSKLSLNKAGRLCNITGSAIAHIEQGRMEVSTERIKTMVAAYGCTMDDFFEYMDGDKAVPVNFRDECFILLRDMPDSKIQLAFGVLQSLAK